MEKQIFNRQISKHGLQKRIIDEQQIDANVTTREIENLFEYNESLDINTKNHVIGSNVDDDILVSLIKKFGYLLAEPPFLQESMMLEREEGLNDEEKWEAEMLYEHEMRGGYQFNFTHPNALPQFPTSHLNYYPKTNFGSTNRSYLNSPFLHPSPLPKMIGLRSNSITQTVNTHANGGLIDYTRGLINAAPRLILIKSQITLPNMTNEGATNTFYTIKPGQKAKFSQSERGTFIVTSDDQILDATDCRLSDVEFLDVPLFKPPIPNEIIQIDD